MFSIHYTRGPQLSGSSAPYLCGTEPETWLALWHCCCLQSETLRIHYSRSKGLVRQPKIINYISRFSLSKRWAYLKMWTRNTFGNLSEERLLYFHKLRRLNHIQNFLNFTQEHNLLLWTRLWPKFKQPLYDRLRQRRIFLQELHHTVRQLGVVQGQTLYLVKGQQDLHQKLFMLRF